MPIQIELLHFLKVVLQHFFPRTSVVSVSSYLICSTLALSKRKWVQFEFGRSMICWAGWQWRKIQTGKWIQMVSRLPTRATGTLNIYSAEHSTEYKITQNTVNHKQISKHKLHKYIPSNPNGDKIAHQSHYHTQYTVHIFVRCVVHCTTRRTKSATNFDLNVSRDDVLKFDKCM